MKLEIKKVLVPFLLLGSASFLAQSGSFQEFSFQCKDGKVRPYVLYTPAKLADKNKNPLMVFLHGSVSSPEIKKNPKEYAQKTPLLKTADQGGFYILFPFDQAGATWFDETGKEMVLGQIASIQKNFKINEDKIFLSGFSDGGSGVMYLSLTEPEKFAGFISFNGNLKVADKLGRDDLYPANLNQKPFLMYNTTGDELYPISQTKSMGDYLTQSNPNFVFKSVSGSHTQDYIDSETQVINQFISTNSLKKSENISWETAKVGSGYDFVKIVSFKPEQVSPAAWHTPYSLKVFNDRANFGLNFDYKHQGKGMKVDSFKGNNSTAEKMGIQKGDIILKMENDEMNSPYAPFIYLAKKKAGEPTSVTILRDGKTSELKGTFNPGYTYEVFENKNKFTAKIETKVEKSVLIIKTSRVEEFEINFSKLPNNIKFVEINGTRSKVMNNKGIAKFRA